MDLGVGLLPVAALLAAAFLARRFQWSEESRIESLLESRWAPLAFGVISAATYWWLAGSLDPVAVIHDEAAYLLQARLFASGRWAGPSPVLPEFFEQFHVFVVPKVAAKYPPGHALALTPGVLLGLPGLMPVVLTGATGGFLFALARRATNPWIALLAWALWLASPGNLRFRASYFSEVTTTTMWLVGWWSLLNWRRSGECRWLLTLACAVAFGAVTRPLTMLAFALPVGAVVLRDVVSLRKWRDLILAAGLGASVLALLPLHNHMVLGDWRANTWTEYARVYLPFDRPGFQTDVSEALRPLPPDMQLLTAGFRPGYVAYTPSAVPRALWERARAVADDAWGTPWTVGFAAFALVGVLAAPAPVLFAAVTAGFLLISYLTYYHHPSWSVYYLEAHPVLAVLAAIGVWQVSSLVVHLGLPRERERWRNRAAAVGLLAVLATMAPFLATRILDGAAAGQATRAYHESFRQLMRAIEVPAIVFIRYAPWHNIHLSLITNPPSYSQAPVWTVYDRGVDNVRLIEAAPDRVPYLFDEASGQLFRLRLLSESAAEGPARVDERGSSE